MGNANELIELSVMREKIETAMASLNTLYCSGCFGKREASKFFKAIGGLQTAVTIIEDRIETLKRVIDFEIRQGWA